MPEGQLLTHTNTGDQTEATLAVDTDARADQPVEPMVFGKFCEHLGNNIYHGMEAQILFNPVFGEWHFRAEHRRQSGGYDSEHDPDRIEEQVRSHSREDYYRPLAYPRETDPDALLEAYRDGVAFGWMPTDPQAVTASPDTGPTGERSQRLEIEAEGGGIRQLTRLPLHRTNGYEFRAQVRAADETTLELVVRPSNGAERLASATIEVDTRWDTVRGRLELPDDTEEDAVHEVVLVATEPANVVVDRMLVYPDDHVNYADPEIIEFLRESNLPLLRWPGGNFASGYDWRDGIGPVDGRPIRINPAWGGLEYNLFGTDEFIQFCDAVGCEPSICVNAGDGTPEEAAAWVEYCNGDAEETELGRLRAEHGHPEPYNITYWEIGNELYGKWQVHWTTAEGNADRYERFREGMLEADPGIKVTATGQVTFSRPSEWNDALLKRCGETVRALSDHILAGGQVDESTDPDELFHAFMGYSEQLGRQFRDTRDRMREAGVDEPQIDVTELQLFAHFQSDAEGGGREGATDARDDGGRLTPETMPAPDTISEALYDAVLRHEFIRRGDFVEMLTHSATVNHGGGLWKQGERVWAHPCHYGRSMGMSLAGKTPVAVEIACNTISTDTAFREIDPIDDVPAIDAIAVIDGDESELTLVIVNRASADDAVELTIDAGNFPAASEANVTSLSGPTMYARNTRSAPERIVPAESTVAFEGGSTTVDLDPYTMLRITVPRDD